MMQLSSSQAFWLGHLYQASEQRVSLPCYAEQQGLNLAELLLWRRRLRVAGVALPKRVSALFASVEVVA